MVQLIAFSVRVVTPLAGNGRDARTIYYLPRQHSRNCLILASRLDLCDAGRDAVAGARFAADTLGAALRSPDAVRLVIRQVVAWLGRPYSREAELQAYVMVVGLRISDSYLILIP